MLIKHTVPILLAALIAPAALGQGSDAAEAVSAADKELQRAVAERNLEQVISFYADDAVLLPAAEPMITGKAAIREEWQEILGIPDFENISTLKRLDVSSSGDLAYTVGTYVTTMAGEHGEEVVEPGKWVSIWKRQADGQWRIVVDTYNTDVPPPDHQ